MKEGNGMATKASNNKVADDVVVVVDESIFATLSKINLDDKIKEKGKLKYLSWASAWSEVKKAYPGATYTIYPQYMDEYGNTRFWHDDGKTGWVMVAVTINGRTLTEPLPIMDFKNKSIPADDITSVEANKAMKRCLVKACAMHGLGLFVYLGEELPETASKILDLQDTVRDLAKRKSALSEKAAEEAVALCREAEKATNPDLEDKYITGKVDNIDDVEVLESLHKKLLKIKK